jgi:uncharacterized small protein (DUF1192 family)
MASKKPELLKLVDWAENLGYQVFFDKDGENNICFETKTIEICSSHKLEERIFILAHECGHIAAKRNKTKQNIGKSSTERAKTIRLWEEMVAWIEARKILCELEIVFNEKRFSAYSSKCLANYLHAFATQDDI